MYGPDTTVDTGFWTASQESASYQELPAKRRKAVEKLDMLTRRRNTFFGQLAAGCAGDACPLDLLVYLVPGHLHRTAQ